MRCRHDRHKRRLTHQDGDRTPFLPDLLEGISRRPFSPRVVLGDLIESSKYRRMPQGRFSRPPCLEPKILFTRYLIGIGLLLLWLSPATAIGQPDCVPVHRVYDGDTVLVITAERRRLVRLVGIDAPETPKQRGQPGQPFSQRARRHLAALIRDRCVQLETHGEDRYGRLLAVIHLDGVNVNLEMVRQGLAEAYGGRTPDGFDRRPYAKAEAAARRSGRGMWVQGAAYRSPLEWKHGD